MVWSLKQIHIRWKKTVQNIVEINFFEPFCHKYAHDEKRL